MIKKGGISMMQVKRSRGFTLIELVVVMVIIGILSIIAVPMYRGYVRRAMSSEGVALVGSVSSAEKIYLAEHVGALAVASTGYSVELDVDARANTYFNAYAVTTGGRDFTVTTSGIGDASGITVTLTFTDGSGTTIETTGL
jgi:prepilin-type N-terminal cleavage/methylation domain-containing protein